MRFRLILGATLLLGYCLFPQSSLGCQLGIKPITKFDPSEYIFVGEVTGFVGPFKSQKIIGEAWGLVIRPEAAVFLPERPKGYFEMFTYQLMSDCSTQGRSKEYLSATYPVGSRVRVIAKRASYLAGVSDSGRIRLEESIDGSGGIYRVNDAGTTAFLNSVYDYRAGRYEGRGTSPDVTPKFEMRKDLLRLSVAHTERERGEILERLVYYPSIWDDFYFAGIAEGQIKSKAKIKALIEKREAEEKMQMDAFAQSNK